MSRRSSSSIRLRFTAASAVCFAVALIAFGATALGLLVNHALAGSLAVGGTAAIGLTYLAMGLMSLDVTASDAVSAEDLSDRAATRARTARHEPVTVGEPARTGTDLPTRSWEVALTAHETT